MNLASALKEIENWPMEEQIELVEQVWERLIDSGWQPELTPEQRAELDRRYEEHCKNPTDVLTWDQIVEHVRRKR